MEEIIEILESIKPNVDYSKEADLYDRGIIDSLDVISIIAELNDVYGITVPTDDIIPENFNSAQAILELAESLCSGQ